MAQHDRVAETLHNLSVSGPGEIRARTETEVCKFCHIPHNTAVPEALWSQELSNATFVTPEITMGRNQRLAAPQPDGTSRLCLSCHDGTVAMGKIAGRREPIALDVAQRLGPGRPGFLGTDLSGSHPISFVLSEVDSGFDDTSRDMGILPLQAIRASKSVKLDEKDRMQCTTCHDPHSDRFYDPGKVPRFWVSPSVQEVCLTCHALK